MKIGVLEWDISALGGRQRTMLAFADVLTGAGHEVTFLSDFTQPAGAWTSKTFLGWFPLSHLRYEQFEWCGLQRQMVAPESWGRFDIILCSYGGWGYLQAQLPNTRIITWVIHPEQGRYKDVREVWTNSRTTKERLCQSERWADADVRVVRAPHDYGLWRAMGSQAGFSDRPTDVLVVGSLLRDKGVVEAVRQAQLAGLTVRFCGAVWAAAANENQQVLRSITDLIGVDSIRINAPYATVASEMARAKVYLSASRGESCSLAIYEAMNAGCQIVARRVGAVQEQVGVLGELFVHDDEIPGALAMAMNDPDPPSDYIAHGLCFDRSRVVHETISALTP